jgi:membrane-associated phospholipid phosphatase
MTAERGTSVMPAAADLRIRQPWHFGWGPTVSIVGWIALTVVVAALADHTLVVRMPEAFPDKTIGRRCLQIPNHLFRGWGFVVLAMALCLLWNERRWKALIGLGVTAGAATAALWGLKLVIGRARLEAGLGWLAFEPFSLHTGFHSFPSGHTMTAVLLTLLVIICFGRWGWLLWPLVVMVAVIRVVLLRHFPSDLIAGAGLALLAMWGCRQWLGDAYFRPLWGAGAGPGAAAR